VKNQEKTMRDINTNELISLLRESFIREKAANVDTCIQANLEGSGGGKWFMKIQNQILDIQEGETDEAQAKVKMNVNDFVDLMSGNLDPFRAFLTGKVKIIGDQSAVIRLSSLFRLSSADLKKLVE